MDTIAGFPAFFINRTEDAERRQVVEKNFHSAGFSPRRVEAVDGLSMSAQELQKISSPEESMQKFDRHLLPGEFGCYLSHFKIYRIMQQENIPAALILEDDVQLSEHFPEIVRSWRRFPGHCQILHLISNIVSKKLKVALPYTKTAIKLTHGYTAIRSLDLIFGTQGYIIRKSYAGELLRTRSVPIVPIDQLLFNWRYNSHIPWVVYKKHDADTYSTCGHTSPLLDSSTIYNQYTVERAIQDLYIPSIDTKVSLLPACPLWIKRNLLRFLLLWIRFLPWNKNKKFSFLDFEGAINKRQLIKTCASIIKIA